MRYLFCRLWPLVLICLLTPHLHAAVPGATGDASWNIAVLKQLLDQTPPGQKLVQIGDMQIQSAVLQHWYNHLTGAPQARSAFDQYFTAWPNGNVYYSFDASVSPAHQQAFRDAAAEWATFANLHFLPRTAETNYVVVTNSPALDGGVSAVGMVGGPQLLQIGPTAWNRSTLCHELGHTLGLVHEHQRSDRDNYVTILTTNIQSGYEFDFVVLPGSLNKSPYDFLSVMHYGQNYFSVDPSLDTIVAKPPYTQYQNLMGHQFDPVLSQSDRAGMDVVYGPGPGASSVVTNTADSGPGSLRAALYYAYDHPGTTITFAIPTSDPGYSNNVFNLLPSDALPSLVDATYLDGGSEPVQNNSPGPAILLNGALCHDPSVYANGLQLKGTNCTVASLIVNDFPVYGVTITGPNAVSNTISGCYLGIDPTGTFGVSNNYCPLQISAGAHNNLVGGLTPADRNIIGGSFYQGLVIHDPGSDNNTVEGNYIGLNAAGTAPLPNNWSGIQIYGGAKSNLIGGYVSAARNVISGNNYQGVVISDPSSDNNIIAGNYIGLDPTGSTAMDNGWSGIEIFGGAQSNVIGGASPAARNIISGNFYQGVLISDTNSDYNLVSENYIGVNPSGSAAIPNGWSGMQCYGGAVGNIIGPSNVISGNLNYGVDIFQPGTVANLVQGNIIGLDVTGTLALGNAYAGIGIYGGSQSNLIGGTLPGQGNVISGNQNQGIAISGTGTENNVVQGNYIGVDATGSQAIGNGWAGVDFSAGAATNLLGGSLPGAHNVISGNHNQGILLQDGYTDGNQILGNFIGLNARGSYALSNTWDGIEIYDGPSATQIGGPGGERNVISGNGIYGIGIDTTSDGNFVQGNTIGLDAANANPVPNAAAAVAIYGNSKFNLIGGVTPGTANLIADSVAEGVSISDVGSVGNTVRGNSIFGSAYAPIALYNNANNNIAPPVLSSAAITTNCVVTGTFNGQSGTTYTLDFYADAPPATTAQARTYLGSTAVTGAGQSSGFNLSLGAHLPSGRSLTATATDPTGNTSALANGVAVSLISSVNDGIPDAWRARYFGGNGATTNATSAATADPDHDGLNNLQEFLAGTDPTSSNSVLYLTALSPTVSTNAVALHSANGIVYQVWYSDVLSPASWSLLADQVVGNGGDIPIWDPSATAADQRFYRAQVVW